MYYPKCIFEKKTKLHHNWIKGKLYEITALEELDLKAGYNLKIGDQSFDLVVGEKEAYIQENDSTKIKVTYKQERGLIQLSFRIIDTGQYRLSGIINESSWSGQGTSPDGAWLNWEATKKDLAEEVEEKKEEEKEKELGKIIYPLMAYGWENPPKTYSRMQLSGRMKLTVSYKILMCWLRMEKFVKLEITLFLPMLLQ